MQEITAVDYRAFRDIRGAPSLKGWLLPGSLVEFEAATAKAGINPDTEIDQITLVNYHGADGLFYTVAIVQGTFDQKDVLGQMKSKKVKPEKYLLSYLYPAGGMRLVFLDPSTVLLGETAAVKGAINVHDNGAPSLESNRMVNDLIADVSSAPAWSVLGQAATQNMIRGAIGRDRTLGDFTAITKRLQASDYEVNFGEAITFDVSLKTSDTVTAGVIAT